MPDTAETVKAYFNNKHSAVQSIETTYSSIGGVTWGPNDTFTARNGDTGDIAETTLVIYDTTQHL